MTSGGARRAAICLPDMGGGGAERVALEIIDELIAAGHEVDLVLVRAAGALLELVPPEVRIVDLQASRMAGALLPLMRYFRRERPDALQVSMWPLTAIAILAHRLARSRARLMTSDHIAFSSVPRSERRAFQLSATPLYPLADIRVAVSQGVADDLARLTGLNRSRILVIYNPISPPPTISSNAVVEALWGGEGPRIIAVGSLKEQKNHALLVRAFARLRRDNAKLMILGEGPLRPDLERLASDLGISEQVLLPGFKIDPWPFYASASLFVLSSDYEGFANVVLEAMAAGLPVVSTDCQSGPAEILDHGRFGALVPVGDEAALAAAMARALDDPGNPEPRQARAATFSQGSARRYRELLVPAPGDPNDHRRGR